MQEIKNKLKNEWNEREWTKMNNWDRTFTFKKGTFGFPVNYIIII